MIKSFLIVLFFCLLFLAPANAQHLKDDRYPNWDNRMTGKIVYKSEHHVKKHYRKRKHLRRIRYHKPAGLHFLADAGKRAFTTPIRRISEAALTLGGRPTGAPPAWCGFWLGRHLGMLDRRLWLARNWASVGAPARPAAGAIVVWNHHVGQIKAVDGHRIRVLSGNDGHRVRERWRTMAGVIAIRRI